MMLMVIGLGLNSMKHHKQVYEQ
uniref:Uncharacterized protein n=1 Tax=Arundo donax TaxID=35708 RepID=A0A0A8YS04_ARUDO